jgi:hypothetical protein
VSFSLLICIIIVQFSVCLLTVVIQSKFEEFSNQGQLLLIVSMKKNLIKKYFISRKKSSLKQRSNKSYQYFPEKTI